MVIQKSVRSLKTSDRVFEIQREVDGCKFDAILSSETWRLSGVETRPQIHGCFTNFKNEHGVGILLNKKVQWREYINERAIAALITVNKQRIMPMSVYFPHTDIRDMLIITSKTRSDPSRSTQNRRNTFKLLLQISTPNWDLELE